MGIRINASDSTFTTSAAAVTSWNRVSSRNVLKGRILEPGFVR